MANAKPSNANISNNELEKLLANNAKGKGNSNAGNAAGNAGNKGNSGNKGNVSGNAANVNAAAGNAKANNNASNASNAAKANSNAANAARAKANSNAANAARAKANSNAANAAKLNNNGASNNNLNNVLESLIQNNNQKPVENKSNKPNIIEQSINSIGDKLGGIKDSIGDTLSKSGTELGNMSANKGRKNEKFVEENTKPTGDTTLYLAMKVIIMVVVLLVLYYLGNYLINKYLITSASTPMLLNTTKNAKSALVVSQDPTSINYIPINKSDGQDGIQFTYGFWFLIDNFDYKKGEWKHIFHKGNSSSYPNRAPGVWFHPDKNSIRVYMNTMDNILEYADIDNIPVNKWVYMNIILNNKNLDLYINGYIKIRKELTSIPKQNDDDFWVNMYGGFEGYLSNIRYYSYAIDFNEINSNIKAGPSTNNCIDTGEVPPYLDDNWWSM